MVEIANADAERILACLDIALAHYRSLKGLRASNHAWAIGKLRSKIKRKINNQPSKNSLKK